MGFHRSGKGRDIEEGWWRDLRGSKLCCVTGQVRGASRSTDFAWWDVIFRWAWMGDNVDSWIQHEALRDLSEEDTPQSVPSDSFGMKTSVTSWDLQGFFYFFSAWKPVGSMLVCKISWGRQGKITGKCMPGKGTGFGSLFVQCYLPGQR